MATQLFIGVDPGQGGGIAVVNAYGRPVAATRMPATDRDILETLSAARGTGAARAVLEFVRSSPQMGVVSAFKFGCGYGGLRMALVALGIPLEEVVPRRWQGALSCLSGGDKNVTKAKAQELFPEVTVTHAVADALLLAEYCRRLHLGALSPAHARAVKSSRTKSSRTELF